MQLSDCNNFNPKDDPDLPDVTGLLGFSVGDEERRNPRYPELFQCELISIIDIKKPYGRRYKGAMIN